jgi:hypothetical protein
VRDDRNGSILKRNRRGLRLESCDLKRLDLPLDLASGFAFGHAQIVEGLEVQLELRAGAETTCEA